MAPDDDKELSTAEDSDNRYAGNGGTPATGRSRYLALKERRTRLARSRSSHNLGNDDEDPDEPIVVSPTTASPSAYLASRCDLNINQETSILITSEAKLIKY